MAVVPFIGGIDGKFYLTCSSALLIICSALTCTNNILYKLPLTIYSNYLIYLGL